MANFPQSLSVGVDGFGGGASSSSPGARAPANKDQRVQSVEELVLDLINPDLREKALLELSKVYSSHFRGLLSSSIYLLYHFVLSIDSSGHDFV